MGNISRLVLTILARVVISMLQKLTKAQYEDIPYLPPRPSKFGQSNIDLKADIKFEFVNFPSSRNLSSPATSENSVDGKMATGERRC